MNAKPKYNLGDFIPHYGIVRHVERLNNAWIYTCSEGMSHNTYSEFYWTYYSEKIGHNEPSH